MEVITVDTCSLLSLIGLQLVLIVCEGGPLLSPEEKLTVSGNSGEVSAMKFSPTLRSQVLYILCAYLPPRCTTVNLARQGGKDACVFSLLY